MNNKKLSDDERIKSFYRAVGKAMRDHGIEAIAGVWFGADDLHGQLLFYNVADLRMGAVVKAIAKKWDGYLEAAKIDQGETLDAIRELNSDGSENN